MPSSQTLSALQEKGFRTTFRGFDKNDVLAYLNALDNENRQHSAEQEEQIAQLQAQLDKMRSEQSAARACVEKLQSDLSAANQRAEAAEKSAAEVVARAKSVEERATANLSRNKENQQAVVEWQFRCRDLQKQIDEYEKQIAEYEAMIPKGGMPAPKQEAAPAPQPTPQEKPEPAPEPKAPQADVTEEARIEARQILMEARLKADAAEERLKQQAEEQQGRMTEHARDLAASLAMLRERVTRVDERLSAATADLDDATTAIYQHWMQPVQILKPLVRSCATLERTPQRKIAPLPRQRCAIISLLSQLPNGCALCAASRRCRPIMQTPTACAAQVIPAAV